MAATSALVHDDATTTWKRYYATSESAGWNRGPFADVAMTLAVARAHLPGGVAGLRLRVVVWLGIARWMLRRPVGMLINPLRDIWHRRRTEVSTPA